MRSLSSGLVSAIVVGLAMAGSVGAADARGGRGGIAAGGRARSAFVTSGARFGGRNVFARRSGDRFGRGGYGYGFGYPGLGFGGFGDGSGYGAPYAGSFAPAFDPGPPTSIGIPAPPVAPPAIYVLGSPSRSSAVSARGGRSSRTQAAQPAGEPGRREVAAAGPRIIRIMR